MSSTSGGGTGPRRTRARSLSADRGNSKIGKISHQKSTPSSSKANTGNKPFDAKLITIPTNNMYDHLSRDVTEQEDMNVNSKPAARPPPLCIFNQKINDLTEKIKVVIPDPTNVRIRMTQHGTKVYVNSIEEFKKLKTLLETRKVDFYTHSLPSERTTKFVIYGLLQCTNPALMKEALATHGLVPVDIKKLSVKNPRYNDQATFLLYFKQSEKITLAKLQQVKAIDHLVVSFRPYSRNFVGPTQCAKCLHFGHGKQNCNLLSRCVRCGGNHASSDCSLVQNKDDPRSRIPQDQVKCANCGGLHTANFNRCPARLQYIQMKQVIHQGRVPKQPRQVPIVRRVSVAPPPQPLHDSWASIVAKGTNNTPKANDQLTPEECIEVFDHFTTLCDQGLTVQQQIRAIAQFTFTFMYNRTRNGATR